MDNVKKVNHFIDKTLAQTFRSCLHENQYVQDVVLTFRSRQCVEQ
jgi:hypothetical protein